MLILQQDQLDYSPEEMAAFLAVQALQAEVDAIFGGSESPFDPVAPSDAEIYAEAWLAEFNANPNYAPEYVNPYVSFEYVEPEPDVVQQMQDSLFDF